VCIVADGTVALVFLAPNKLIHSCPPVLPLLPPPHVPPALTLECLWTSWTHEDSRAMGPLRALQLVQRCHDLTVFLAFNRPGCLTTTPTPESLHEPTMGSDTGQVKKRPCILTCMWVI
jgi:hypothetical protein